MKIPYWLKQFMAFALFILGLLVVPEGGLRQGQTFWEGLRAAAGICVSVFGGLMLLVAPSENPNEIALIHEALRDGSTHHPQSS